MNRLKQLAYKNREEIMEIGPLPMDVLPRRLALEYDASRPQQPPPPPPPIVPLNLPPAGGRRPCSPQPWKPNSQGDW